MGITQSFMMAIKSLANNKMRAFLTMLGIVIGVGSVILIMSLGAGLKNQVSESFEGMGTRTLTVGIYGRGSNRSFTVDDLYAFAKEHNDTIKAVSPNVYVSAEVKYQNIKTDSYSSVQGVGEDWLTIKSYKTDSGRFLSYMDIAARNKVCFVGAYINSSQMYNGQALGKKIKLNGDLYTIVGVAAEIYDAEDEYSTDNFIVIPYTSAAKINRDMGFSDYSVLATSDEAVSIAKKQLENELSKIYPDDYSYNVSSLSEMLNEITEIMDTMILVIAAIAAISLFVGGIGIMNIMLVSVTERTREIGIRKALGAKQRDIKTQFIIEAATTSLMGGFLGLILGIVGANAVAPLLELKAATSIESIILSVGISVGIGILFGYLPAKKASALNPIDALRRE